MGLANPHIRMQIVGIQTVPICLLLCFDHDGFQLVRKHKAVFALFKYCLFKQEAGIDITDNLCQILQLIFNLCDFFLTLRLLDCGIHNDVFIEC